MRSEPQVPRELPELLDLPVPTQRFLAPPVLRVNRARRALSGLPVLLGPLDLPDLLGLRASRVRPEQRALSALPGLPVRPGLLVPLGRLAPPGLPVPMVKTERRVLPVPPDLLGLRVPPGLRARRVRSSGGLTRNQ